MNTYTLSAGRNYSGTDTEMPARKWRMFTGSLLMWAKQGGEVVFCGTGTGYDTTTTNQEQSFTVVFLSSEGPSKFRKYMLSRLAYKYHQDCIALTEGTTEFVTPE